MIQIEKEDFERLRKAGLIRDTLYNRNYTIINKGKKSHHKKYFVMEEKKILAFLGLLTN